MVGTAFVAVVPPISPAAEKGEPIEGRSIVSRGMVVVSCV